MKTDAFVNDRSNVALSNDAFACRYSTTAGSHLRYNAKHLHSPWYQRTCLEAFDIMEFYSRQAYSSRFPSLSLLPVHGSLSLAQIDGHITGGDIFGVVPENRMITHRVMLHPKAKGKVTYIAPEGNYTLDVRRTLSYLT